jgi:N-acetylglucosaminyldiphosphoundecaprenol N-acetyl-beta-D-mannosaminyltransferase
LRIDVLGVGIDNLTPEEAIERGAGLAAGEKFAYAVTPNPEFLLMAKKNEKFRAVLNGADLVLADGIGVVKAAAILGRPLKGRVPGIDFAAGLLGRMAQSGERLFLLGAKPGIAETAAANLQKQYPGLMVCGTHDGYFQDPRPVIRAIQESHADVVFVCLGAPKQELWMAEYGPSTGARLMVGLGGSLDVFAGAVERAPEKWQKMGMEWLYRLLKEPKRIGRMAKLPLVLVDAAGARLRGK